jgi:signal transduction histidine kinase
MQPAAGLRRKIWIAFILQVAAISFATVLGVYGASAIIKDVLIHRALIDEAAHYWKRWEAEPGAALPDTYNMKGYLLRAGESPDALPEGMRDLGPGYHALPKVQGGALILVDDNPQGRLLLVFAQSQVDALAFFFGAVPLVLVLIVIYVIAWFTYRVSRRAVSPVIWLSDVVRGWDPKRPAISAIDPDNLPVDVEGETQVLALALHDFASRIERFVERERNFTRDASHELRTPLTVIRMACDLLEADGELAPYSARSVKRIKSAALDMEALIESFLILAREGDTGLPEEDFVVAEVVADEVEKLRPLVGDKPVELKIEEVSGFALHGSPRVLAVILSNLVRNACLYTEQGSVTVRIETDRVEVIDTGIGMNADELARAFEPFFRGGDGRRSGQGVGLTIVRRLSERFGWPVSLESEAGKGTRATIRFPSPQPLEG